MSLLNLFIFPFIVSFVVSSVVTPIIIKYAKGLKILDDPRINKHPKVIHTKPTPRGGGIPIFLAILTSSLIFIPLDIHIASILMGGFVVFLMGFLDDRYNLNPYLRLFLGILAALIPVYFGVGIDFLTNPLGGIIDLTNPIISKTFAVFWIVFMMNMINMGAKGIDGQLSGVVVVSAITITALSLYHSADITQWPVSILTSITGGAFMGFLLYHKFPQKIMPGYGGATLAGYFLAISSILSTTKVGTLIVVLGVPLIDTGFVVIRRILAGKSPVWGDRGHFHHKLLDNLGLSKKQVAQVYWSITAILGVLALNLNSTYKLYTIIGVALTLGGFILWLTRRSK
jgi:UDP-GlcNAc:undecaprenyl-phosphate GlcNAc-1-phosphate transferase